MRTYIAKRGEVSQICKIISVDCVMVYSYIKLRDEPRDNWTPARQRDIIEW